MALITSGCGLIRCAAINAEKAELQSKVQGLYSGTGYI